jgi:hypothetical protein
MASSPAADEEDSIEILSEVKPLSEVASVSQVKSVTEVMAALEAFLVPRNKLKSDVEEDGEVMPKSELISESDVKMADGCPVIDTPKSEVISESDVRIEDGSRLCKTEREESCSNSGRTMEEGSKFSSQLTNGNHSEKDSSPVDQHGQSIFPNFASLEVNSPAPFDSKPSTAVDVKARERPSPVPLSDKTTSDETPSTVNNATSDEKNSRVPPSDSKPSSTVDATAGETKSLVPSRDETPSTDNEANGGERNPPSSFSDETPSVVEDRDRNSPVPAADKKLLTVREARGRKRKSLETNEDSLDNNKADTSDQQVLSADVQADSRWGSEYIRHFSDSVGEMVRYRCQICCREVDQLTEHVEAEHGMPLRQYSRTHQGITGETRTVHHR